MTTMIERVAVALMQSRYRQGKPAHLQPEKQSAGGILLPQSVQQDNWEECVRDARAAIAAMREPTSHMVAAGHGPMAVQTRQWADDKGYHVEVIHPGDGLYVPPTGSYQAMIDAALAEGAPSD